MAPASAVDATSKLPLRGRRFPGWLGPFVEATGYSMNLMVRAGSIRLSRASPRVGHVPGRGRVLSLCGEQGERRELHLLVVPVSPKRPLA
jgi:hypothetical protein